MFSRRLFLASSCAAVWLPTPAFGASRKYPFTLGVASGSPRANSVVLWTRLAPDPLNGGGMPPGPAAVRYRLCSDEGMRNTVREGLVTTNDHKGHAVHVLAGGLQPGRDYWYQFYFGEDDSPVGRTRTADPGAGSTRLALANCQAWQANHYAAYRDMAEWMPDCVIHVGDYIYEGGIAELGPRRREYNGHVLETEIVRQHNGPEITTLWDYRNRYALYRSDPHLQAAHAAAPWIMAMDDHEIDNNWAGEVPQDPEKQTPLEFRVRKRAALQAYYEHMPLEHAPVMDEVSARLRMHDAYRLGPAQIFLLDTRQYRSDQVCGDGGVDDFPCEALHDPARTMTGEEQEQWLVEGLRRSDARLNVIAQQTWFAPYEYVERPGGRRWNMDQWDGYPAQRQRLIDAMAEVANPVVLSGDWHCAAAMTIHQDPYDATSRRIGHNFAATSIASDCPWQFDVAESQPLNPHAKYVNGAKRGYLRCLADGERWTSVFRTVDQPSQANSPVRTDAEIRITDV